MIDNKPILSIETSGSLCSSSLFFSDEKYFLSSTNLKNSHSENLFNQIEFLFDQAEISRDNIGSIAVSGGPGSFTGLRIGMAAAKGIASGAKHLHINYLQFYLKVQILLLPIKLIKMKYILPSFKLGRIVIYLRTN